MEDRPPLVDPEDVGTLKPTPGFAEATHSDLEHAAYRQELRSTWTDPGHRLDDRGARRPTHSSTKTSPVQYLNILNN